MEDALFDGDQSDRDIQGKVENTLKLLNSSWERAIMAETRKESIGSAICDYFLKMEKDIIGGAIQKSRTQLAQSFEAMIATIVMYAGRKDLLESQVLLPVRHVHYNVTPTSFPLFKQALIRALEQILADNWSTTLEAVWESAWDTVADYMMGATSKAQLRLKKITDTWLVAVEQLKLEAFIAKLHANLMVDAQRRGQSMKDAVVRHLAVDCCSLISKMIEILTDEHALQGLTCNLGLDFRMIFHNSGGVPDLKQIGDVVITTMKEVAGSVWDGQCHDAWSWLWSLALSERRRRWTRASKDEFLAGWKVVESKILTKIAYEYGGGGLESDFYADSHAPPPALSELPQKFLKHQNENLSGARGGGTQRDLGLEYIISKRKQKSANGGGSHAGEVLSITRGLSDFDARIDNEENVEERGTILDENDSERGPLGPNDFGALNSIFHRQLGGDLSGNNSAQMSDILWRSPALQKLATRVDPETGNIIISRKVSFMIGTSFYDALFSQTPSMRRIFIRPRESYGALFILIFQMLFDHLDNPYQMWNQNQELALKHINFGVRPTDVRLFGKVLLDCLETLADGGFSKSQMRSWERYYDITSTALNEVILVGSHPITQSLLLADKKMLGVALAEAPRNQRASWACKVSLKGGFKSPLYWALETGLLEMARMLLADLLAMRADRATVYCGRKELWDAHPDLVNKLCLEGAELISTLLDGSVWWSNQSFSGKRRINLYIKELWQERARESVYESPLMELLKLKDVLIFDHIVLKMLVALKWSLYGRTRAYILHTFFIIQLVFFLLGFTTFIGRNNPGVGFTFRILCSCIACFPLGAYLFIAMEQWRLAKKKEKEQDNSSIDVSYGSYKSSLGHNSPKNSTKSRDAVEDKKNTKKTTSKHKTDKSSKAEANAAIDTGDGSPDDAAALENVAQQQLLKKKIKRRKTSSLVQQWSIFSNFIVIPVPWILSTNPFIALRLLSSVLLLITFFVEVISHGGNMWYQISSSDDLSEMDFEVLQPDGDGKVDWAAWARYNQGVWSIAAGACGWLLFVLFLESIMIISEVFTYLIQMIFKAFSEALAFGLISLLLIAGFAASSSALSVLAPTATGTSTSLTLTEEAPIGEQYDVSFGDALASAVDFFYGPWQTKLDSTSVSNFTVLNMVLRTLGVMLLSILAGRLCVILTTSLSHKDAFVCISRAQIMINIERMLPKKFKSNLYCSLNFDVALPLDNGEKGPAGGVVLLVPAKLRMPHSSNSLNKSIFSSGTQRSHYGDLGGAAAVWNEACNGNSATSSANAHNWSVVSAFIPNLSNSQPQYTVLTAVGHKLERFKNDSNGNPGAPWPKETSDDNVNHEFEIQAEANLRNLNGVANRIVRSLQGRRRGTNSLMFDASKSIATADNRTVNETYSRRD